MSKQAARIGLQCTSAETAVYMCCPAPGAMLAASDLGLVTVSSMDSTRQAASVAAVSALILTSDGSHTYDSYVSTTPPVHSPASVSRSRARQCTG